MPKIFLCVDYGSPENWILEEFETIEKAIEHVKKGSYLGLEWKIVKELEITVKKEKDA